MIGTVISYDPHTGHNQVRTSYGFVLTDLAVITGGRHVLPELATGDHVLVLDGVIVGRVAMP